MPPPRFRGWKRKDLCVPKSRFIRIRSDLRGGHRFRTPHLADSGLPSSLGRADYTNRFRPIFCGIEFSVRISFSPP